MTSTASTTHAFLTTIVLFLLFQPCTTAPPLLSPHEDRDVSSTSKAGLAWGGDAGEMQQYTTTGKVSWYYTWSPDAASSASLEFVPMLWGQREVDDFVATINGTIQAGGVKAVLGMNEPQETGQSNLTPEEGAEMWKTYLEPLRAQGVRLGSPAPSGAPSGKTWIQDFLTACNGGCTVDFIALHWYDVNATEFIDYLNDFHDTFQRPLWVTEWACQNFNGGAQCSADDVREFLNTTQAFMDGADFVERYAWFGAMPDLQGVNAKDALMTSKGAINDLGKQYIGETTGSSGGGSGGSPTVSAAATATPRWWALQLALVCAAAGSLLA